MESRDFDSLKGLRVGDILGSVSDSVHDVHFMDRDGDPDVLGTAIITLDSGCSLVLEFDTIFFQSPYNAQHAWNVDSLMLETPTRITVRRGSQRMYDSFHYTEQ